MFSKREERKGGELWIKAWEKLVDNGTIKFGTTEQETNMWGMRKKTEAVEVKRAPAVGHALYGTKRPLKVGDFIIDRADHTSHPFPMLINNFMEDGTISVSKFYVSTDYPAESQHVAYQGHDFIRLTRNTVRMSYADPSFKKIKKLAEYIKKHGAGPDKTKSLWYDSIFNSKGELIAEIQKKEKQAFLDSLVGKYQVVITYNDGEQFGSIAVNYRTAELWLYQIQHESTGTLEAVQSHNELPTRINCSRNSVREVSIERAVDQIANFYWDLSNKPRKKPQ